MNPYETTIQSEEQVPNPTLKKIKSILTLAVVIVFFTGCFKIGEGIPITEFTTFNEIKEVSLFHAIFVLPMAKLMIVITQWTKSVFLAIVITTLINRTIGSLLSFKSTIESEKMKELQPEMNSINLKYAGKKDRESVMSKNMDMQKLFKKHNVDPMGSMGTMLMSLPLFMGIYVAVKDNAFIADKLLLGVKTSLTTAEAMKLNFNAKIVVTIAILVIFQFLSIKVPTWLSSSRSKVKIKATGKEADLQKNMAIFIPLMMLLVSWQVSIALLVYFTVSPIFTILQSYLIHNYIIEKEEKVKKEVNKLY